MDERPPLNYAQPPEPNSNRAFNGMIVGVIIGWFSGILLWILLCVFASYGLDPTTWKKSGLIAGVTIAIVSAVGGGWVGRNVGLRR